MQTTFEQIENTTTPEYLGANATEADVESYLALLEERWPDEEALDSDSLDVLQTATFKAWCLGARANADVAVTSVRRDTDSDEDGGGVAYWVHASIGEMKVKLYAAPHADGRPGLEPCSGGSLETWCDEKLIRAYGRERANELAREAIALARI